MHYAILLSPSEDKIKVLQNLSIQEKISQKEKSQEKDLCFLESLWQGKPLYTHRKSIVKHYYDILKQLLCSHDSALLESMYGAKKFHDSNIFDLQTALTTTKLTQAISLYSGVAFQALNFSSLAKAEQDFLLENVYIFSNLFGVVQAKDSIPFYKLKQGTKEKFLTLKEVYAPFAPLLHHAFQDKAFIIDLRAGIYTKLFMPEVPHFFFEFHKNGKTISHYAKLYRGKILRYLAQEKRDFSMQECLEYLSSLHNEEFCFESYMTQKNRFTLSYRIF